MNIPTVKDFIEFIRPITCVNPDTKIIIQDYEKNTFTVDYISFDGDTVHVQFKKL